MQLITKIKSLSQSNEKFREEWTLIQTVPKLKTIGNIKCLCTMPTNNYRIYFNNFNANIIKLGLDCRNNHLESFTQIGLEESSTVSMKTLLIKELTSDVANHQNLNHFFVEDKKTEMIFRRAIENTIETALNNENVNQAVKDVIETMTRVSNFLSPKYQIYLAITIEKLQFKIVLQILEPIELNDRSTILLEREEGYKLILKEYSQLSNLSQMIECNMYLSDIPITLSTNLKTTYILPADIWQLQQTNGFIRWKKRQCLDLKCKKPATFKFDGSVFPVYCEDHSRPSMMLS